MLQKERIRAHTAPNEAVTSLLRVQRYNISDNRQNITGLFCGKNEIRNTIHYIYNTRANKQRGRKDEKRQEETGKGILDSHKR